MTQEEIDKLLSLLERIAVALEPKSAKRPDIMVPDRGGRRKKIEFIVEEIVKGLVKETSLKKK
jgi:hypothetical protein